MQPPLLKSLALAALLPAALAALLPMVPKVPIDGGALDAAVEGALDSALDSALKVVKTTVTDSGQVIDWIVPESQGELASPPPAPPKNRRGGGNAKMVRLEALLAGDAASRGPEGTVPILRAGSGPALPSKRLPLPGDHHGSDQDRRRATAAGHGGGSYAGEHWYASSGQRVANRGGRAVISLYRAYVDSDGDFSLLQTAVIRDDVAPAEGGARVSQTVEAGWINYPNQAHPPHLFAYYTTNGYAADGNGTGGWNRDQGGWVQTDRDIYPGMALGPLSVDGGPQFELELGFLLHRGNWWLWVLDRFIGYYPGGLFARAGAEAGGTLAAGADLIDFYGEVYNSRRELTTTDMGSGEFPGRGYGRAAYMRNLAYFDGGGVARDYDGRGSIIVSDPDRYRIETAHGRGWGSYLFVGGPGAGGVVGG